MLERGQPANQIESAEAMESESIWNARKPGGSTLLIGQVLAIWQEGGSMTIMPLGPNQFGAPSIR